MTLPNATPFHTDGGGFLHPPESTPSRDPRWPSAGAHGGNRGDWQSHCSASTTGRPTVTVPASPASAAAPIRGHVLVLADEGGSARHHLDLVQLCQAGRLRSGRGVAGIQLDKPRKHLMTARMIGQDAQEVTTVPRTQADHLQRPGRGIVQGSPDLRLNGQQPPCHPGASHVELFQRAPNPLLADTSSTPGEEALASEASEAAAADVQVERFRLRPSSARSDRPATCLTGNVRPWTHSSTIQPPQREGCPLGLGN